MCVCVSATPAGLPTRHGSIRDQRPPFPLLSCPLPPPLQAQRVLNLKSKAQRALSQHAPFAASVSSPLPLGTWLKATRISVSGLFLQPSASSAFPLPLHPSTFWLRNCAISLASCEFSLPQTAASAAASIVQIASAIRPQVTQL